jgi:hypothetical protein
MLLHTNPRFYIYPSNKEPVLDSGQRNNGISFLPICIFKLTLLLTLF